MSADRARFATWDSRPCQDNVRDWTASDVASALAVVVPVVAALFAVVIPRRGGPGRRLRVAALVCGVAGAGLGLGTVWSVLVWTLGLPLELRRYRDGGWFLFTSTVRPRTTSFVSPSRSADARPLSAGSDLTACGTTACVRYVEVEKKFALPDPAPLKARLAQLGALPGPPVRQVDAYYNAPHRDFLVPAVISEWLRIRVEGDGGSVNFKRFHPLDAVAKTHADEFEAAVDDVEAVRRLLEALDFRPLVTVEKTRETYLLADVEVALDRVVGAGDFVEFEFKGDADSVGDATRRLDRCIDSLGVALGAPVGRGYPHMLLGRDH